MMSEAARLVLGRHEEEVRPRLDEVREAFVEADAHRDAVRVLRRGGEHRLLDVPVAGAERHELRDGEFAKISRSG